MSSRVSQLIRMGHIALFAMGSVLVLFSGTAWAAEHTKDSVATIKQNLAQKKAVLIDVREVNETNAGYVRGATLAPLSELKQDAGKPDFAAKIGKEIPRDKVIYMYCRSGRRCLAATDLLRELGYDARALKLGYEGLAEQGFEVAKPTDPPPR